MKNKELFRTNLLISMVLVIGFLITAVFSYRANYQESVDSLEQVSALSTEGIYHQFTAMLTKPVNISLTMAHDRLLEEYLSHELERQDDEAYVRMMQEYLHIYREKYGFDSVFLVSAATGRYYNFDGIDRILTKGDPENDWYFELMGNDLEYSINVDNDEVDGSGDAITAFVNCKIQAQDGRVLGIVGVGIRDSYLKDFLKKYEDAYQVEVYLLNEAGTIEISTTYTGYEAVDWFDIGGRGSIREQVLSWKDDEANLEVWAEYEGGRGKNFVVSRYIPELSWHLVVEQNDRDIIRAMQFRISQSVIIITAVILIVMFVVTTVIRNFNREIMALVEERQEVFKKATEQLYDTINELNITRNTAANERTKEYFDSLGARGLPYDQGLKVIAEKQIKEEFRDGYVSTFTPENVIREYEAGNDHLSYDFMITQDGVHYFWMRIDAHVFFSKEDGCLHMFTYRKNIDADKKKEMMAYYDEMTKLLTKTAVRRRITAILSQDPEGRYAFFLFDIDNFKQVNDSLGHAFGDLCIKEFTGIIRKHFREEDVLGRIGGDEFVAFIPVPDQEWVEAKAREMSAALNFVCEKAGKSWELSASIGIAAAPVDGSDFVSLYEKADAALYRTKQNGKNGYFVYGVSVSSLENADRIPDGCGEPGADEGE